MPGKICEITPLDLCDRLNLELGIVKLKPPAQIHELLGTQDLDQIRKTMIHLKMRKIIDTIKNSLVIERRDTVLSLVETVELTKKKVSFLRNSCMQGTKNRSNLGTQLIMPTKLQPTQETRTSLPEPINSGEINT